jgi:hypothetical protein
VMHLELASRAKFNHPTENRNLHRDKTTKIRIYYGVPTRTSLLQTTLGLHGDLSRFSRTLFPPPSKGAGNSEI